MASDDCTELFGVFRVMNWVKWAQVGGAKVNRKVQCVQRSVRQQIKVGKSETEIETGSSLL